MKFTEGRVYTEPCSSDVLDIVFVTPCAGNTVSAEISPADTAKKVLKLLHGHGFVLMPMLHNEWSM